MSSAWASSNVWYVGAHQYRQSYLQVDRRLLQGLLLLKPDAWHDMQGFARLLYHGPAFGVLDECSSAVSVDAEEKLCLLCSIILLRTLVIFSLKSCTILNADQGWSFPGSRYKAAVDLGISCVTVSQRLTLPEFHCQELRLGENCRSGWSLHPVDPQAHTTLASAT